MPLSGRATTVSARQKSSRPIVSPDEASDGGSQIAFRDKMNEDREFTVVTKTSGVATVWNREIIANVRPLIPATMTDLYAGLHFSPRQMGGTGYTGGITNGPASGSKLQTAVGTKQAKQSCNSDECEEKRVLPSQQAIYIWLYDSR